MGTIFHKEVPPSEPSQIEMLPKYHIIDTFKSETVFNWVYQFKVPLFYHDPSKGKIDIVAKITQLYKDTTTESRLSGPAFAENDKVIVFLQGGPGFPAYTPLANEGFIGALLDKGYTVINYDQRGTGLSTPLDIQTFTFMGLCLGYGKDINDNNIDQYLELVKAFRADSIVEDCETIRKLLFKDFPQKKWSVQGQSYGGYCSHTYLSFYPDSLEEVILTGGIPGLGDEIGPDEVYKATYKRTIERNAHYYAKYPQDVSKVKRIVSYLYSHDVALPSGGKLSVERFQQLGLNFGASGGTDNIRQLIFKFDHELKQFGFPTYNTLSAIEANVGYDSNVIYALFQEAIYLDGPGKKSNWSADRLRYSPEHKHLFAISEHIHHLNDQKWLDDNEKEPIYFTGEMFFKSSFDDYVELKPFKKLAYKIHHHDNWGRVYDPPALRRIYDSLESYVAKQAILPPNSPLKVDKKDVKIIKVVAAQYYNDLYVDLGVSNHTIENYFGKIRTWVTSKYFHNGLRADAKTVMENLFMLLDREVD